MTPYTIAFKAIGTRWTIDVWTDLTTQKWEDLQIRIHQRIETFDRTYSRFRDDSLISEMARAEGSYKMPEDGYALMQFYERLYHATGGKVTPLIGQIMANAGYDAHYSFQSKKLTVADTWDDVLRYSESEIVLQKPALLDFGAAGKGYLVDIVSALLLANEVDNFVINAGGDLLQHTITDQTILVGLEHPLDTTQIIGTVQLQNASLCASAGSRRKWGKYHHIIDPTRLESPTEIIATWVIAKRAILADGLATALFFADPDQLAKQFPFSYAILHKDMSLKRSNNFPVTLFEEN